MTDEQMPQPTPEEPAPIESGHSITLNGTTYDYTAHVGRLPLKNEKDEVQAHMFFTAYILDGDHNPAERPVSFVFNGGPGSSSVWLHMGAVGPVRVVMQDEGWLPAPPYKHATNPATWLPHSDLVFIDTVGTGYSRATDPDKNKDYWGVKADLESVTEFIRLFLGRYNRWASPLFVAGESYGTFRAAGLADMLLNKGIALNGVMLISTVLQMQTIRGELGNDLPYPLLLPSLTATAHFHGKLSKDLQEKSLDDLLPEVEAWALKDYTIALTKGDSLTENERRTIARRLARYTGISAEYIEGIDLRLDTMHFDRELSRDQREAVGRLDSRFRGAMRTGIGEYPDFDPSLSGIWAPYTMVFNDYIRRELGYESDMEYEILSFAVNQGWTWADGHYDNTAEALRSALARNPFMKVHVGMGIYDLATPYLATEYTLGHMGTPAATKENFHMATYPAGHMYYLDVASLNKMGADIGEFFAFALPE